VTNSSPPVNKQVIVVGAGWAGLAAAVELCHRGHRVILIDAGQQLGGRARSIHYNGQTLDNGQHILLGAYKELLGLLKTLGIQEADAFVRTRLNLKIDGLQKTGLHITASQLFSPLHMLFGLITARGLSLNEKRKIIRFWISLQLSSFTIKQDIGLGEFLIKHQQTERITTLFWAPLCVAALNTEISTASTEVFLNVLKNSFTGSRSNSDLLLPKSSLGGILPEPAAHFIQQHGGEIILGERVISINLENEQLTGVVTDKNTYAASHMILATPFKQTYRLLEALPEFSAFNQAIASLEHEPIATLYMQFPENIRIDDYMLGICDGVTQWLIDRRTCGQAGLIAAVISASGKHTAMDKATLTQTILQETARLFPHWPAPVTTFLMREKQATFSCTANSRRFRPSAGHLGKNIWVAGDYLDTGLPATLEGAVISGLQCAREMINQHNTILN